MEKENNNIEFSDCNGQTSKCNYFSINKNLFNSEKSINKNKIVRRYGFSLNQLKREYITQ